jgi:hypothetical protein
MATVAPLFRAALDEKSPHLTIALETVWDWGNYLWAIVHGHAPLDPAVDVLRGRSDGFGAEPLARIAAKVATR